MNKLQEILDEKGMTLDELKALIEESDKKPEYRFKVGDDFYYRDFFAKTDRYTMIRSYHIKQLSLDPAIHATKEDLERYWQNLELKDKIVRRLNELNDGWKPDFSLNTLKWFIVFDTKRFQFDGYSFLRPNKYPAKKKKIWSQICEEFGGIEKVAEALGL